MKKTGILLFCLFLCLAGFSACGKTDTGSGTTEAQGVTVHREQPSAQRNEIELPETDPPAESGAKETHAPLATDSLGQAVYQRPVDKEALDLGGREDISTENIRFTYDELGRIATCQYLSDGDEVSIEYSYLKDGGISMFGFYRGSMIIDTIYFPTSGFDPALGFTSYDGYYFYGYGFGS